MRAIDQQQYQTLNKSLIVSHEHPFRPHHGPSSEGQSVGRKAIMKKVSKLQQQEKTVQKTEYFSTIVKETSEDHSQPNFFVQNNRANTDDLLKQIQAFIIHPQLDMQLQNNSPYNQSNKIQEQKPQPKASTHLQNALTRNTGQLSLKLQDLIDSQKIPMKKQNYFQNIQGFNQFYKSNWPKHRQVAGKRYPILFVSNLSLIVTLLLAFSVDEQSLWIVSTGVCLIYIIIAYFNQLREQVFSLKNLEELQKAFDGIDQLNCFFYFHIECFHYSSIKGKEHKIITYKKCKKMKALNCQDQSIHIEDLINDKNLIVLTTKAQFYFKDKQNEQAFSRHFNKFVEKNKRDTHQKYWFQFKTNPTELFQGAFHKQNSYHNILYIFSTIIGLLFPCAIYLQHHTKRYEASIIKRLSLI